MNNPTQRFLALGDSYTIGEGVVAAQNWPSQLIAQLNAKEKSFDQATIVAKTGWSTDELAAAISAADLSPPYDWVSLSIGVNNQYRGRDLHNFAREFSELLQQAIAFAAQRHERVLVLSIPDWGVTEFAAASGRDVKKIAAEIDQFNAIKQRITQANGAHWINITDISRDAQHRSKLVADGLHPSAAMYGLWAGRVAAVMEQSLA